MWTPIKLCPTCSGLTLPVPGAGPDGPFRCDLGHDALAATSPQERFLSLPVDEALYGGAAGGGKSEAVIVGALRFAHLPRYQGAVFRRTFPELKLHVLERAHALYPQVGGVPSEGGKVWRFPDASGVPLRGGKVILASLDLEADRFKYSGIEFQYLGWDELTTFAEVQYLHLMGRLRSTEGIPTRSRAATNPGGPGHDWLVRRFENWLRAKDPEFDGQIAAPGQPLWFRWDEKLQRSVPCPRFWWHPRCRERIPCKPGAPCPEHRPQSRTFVPAMLKDNPYLAGTGYGAKLDQLDPVTRAQLKFGDWLAKAARGAYFRRAWFRHFDVMPGRVLFRVRFWDRAATEETADNDPDFTCGVRMSLLHDGTLVVEDVVRGQWGPGDVDAEMFATAVNDPPGTEQCFEQEPGASGKSEAFHTVQRLAGFPAFAIRPTGDKPTRMRPLSAQAFARNCAYVAGRWNAAFFGELEACPEGRWDQVDAASGAFARLAPLMPARKDLPNRTPRPDNDLEEEPEPLKLPMLPVAGHRRGHRGGGY